MLLNEFLMDYNNSKFFFTQDAYGDTALHDAIGKESVEILDMLGNSPQLTLKLRNKRGFNVMHHAALKGNNL